MDLVALHRLALAPFRSDANLDRVLEALRQGLTIGENCFLELLGRHGLDALWYEVLKRHNLAGAVPASFLSALKQARRIAAVRYLAQRNAMERIDAAFGAVAVRYAVFKGVHVRELLYADPTLRPAEDIDILIARNQRDLAAKTLVLHGFQLHSDAEIVSHEASFHGHNVAVDLHWDILRPGRTRLVLTDFFLKRRRWEGYFWSLDPNDALFVLLVHPAFAKYVASPGASLCRVVDLSRWLQGREVDWEQVVALLDQAGLKTAAWAVLYRMRQLMGSGVPSEVVNRLQPGRGRMGYLRYWIERNLPSRCMAYPLLIQIAFTLFLHDRPAHALTAIRGWLHHKGMMQKEQKTLLAVLQKSTFDHRS